MTKLFSIKSLACAGAAAFALTLAAAPQASAEALKLTPTVNYATGKLKVTGVGKATVDGSDVAKGLADEGFTGYTYQYKVGTYGNWVTMNDADENTADTALTAAVTAAKNFGTTMYVRVAKFGKPSGDTSKVQLSPWSKETKVKVTAKAKAPKINIKTAALTKAFEWKMGAKVEYKVTVGTKTTYWTVGGDKADWSKIISAAAAATRDGKKEPTAIQSGSKLETNDVTNLVKSDAIANNVTIQLRTAATDKKDASKISVLKLKASKNSPTYDQSKVVAVQASKKGATASAAAITPASIPSGYTAQYSLDSGKTWKNLKKEVRIESDKLNNKTVDLRLVGSDKKKIDLPSAVTTVTIPTNGTNPNAVKDAKDHLVTSKGWKVSTSNLWEANNFGIEQDGYEKSVPSNS